MLFAEISATKMITSTKIHHKQKPYVDVNTQKWSIWEETINILLQINSSNVLCFPNVVE